MSLPNLFSNFRNSLFCRKVENKHFHPKLSFYYGFVGNRLEQNDRNDRGIISGFHQKSDFDPCVAGRRPCFSENIHFHVLCFYQSVSLWRTDMRGVYILRIYNITQPIFFFQNKYFPYMFMDFMHFHWFS